MHKKDNIFNESYNSKFEFNSSIASVFDNMLERSIPFYNEVGDLSIYFILEYLKSKNTMDLHNIIYDLGSSTGNLLLKLEEKIKALNYQAKLYGIDNSQAMINHSKLKTKAMQSDITFICQDFLTYNLLPSSVIISHYTMQFIRPPNRQKTIKKIYDSLESGGLFLFAEKIISENNAIESQMIALYHKYKSKMGYTKNEIYKKREALENILIPYSIHENMQMLSNSGFSHIEIIFKWVNFVLFLAKK